MQLDYDIIKLFSKEPFQYTHIKIKLFKDSVCDQINGVFKTTFVSGEYQTFDIDFGEQIYQYLSDKNNHFCGLFGIETL